MRRWRSSVKPAHPVLFALQAGTTVVAAMLLLSFIRYKKAEPVPPPADYHRTGYNRSIPAPLARVVRELAPGGNMGNTLADTISKAHWRQLNMPLPRPGEEYIPPTAVPRQALVEEKLLPLPDMQTGSGARVVADAGVAVLYSADGTELARWESEFRTEDPTIFRIHGSGLMVRTELVVSCGDKKSDETALRYALARGGVPGTYTVYYPSPAAGGRK